MRRESIERFIGIPEHYLRNIYFIDKEGNETEIDSEVDTVYLELLRSTHRFRCPCGKVYSRYYDCNEVEVTDLSWGPWKKVELIVPRFRVDCDRCGVKTEQLDWLVRNCTYTRRLADAVALACREVRATSAIAKAFNLGWDTVKSIDKAALERDLNPPDFGDVRLLGLDEFALKRGHEYATIFVDLERNRVLWVCRSRKKEAIRKVFKEVFGPVVCGQIEAVAMDMWEPYELAVREFLPQARIVWDRFHVTKNFNREVVDRVRIDEGKACENQEARKYLKGTKFILLKNRRNMRRSELARLKDLLAVNRRIFTVHLLREALSKLWDYSYEKPAREWFASWYSRAIRSRIEPLKRFAKRLKKRLDGILAHCRHPISTGVLEGINNKIKVIKRVAYGYRDHDYFFLKIRAHYDNIYPL
jgi:transposase